MFHWVQSVRLTSQVLLLGGSRNSPLTMVCKGEQELLGTWTLSPFLSPALVWCPADQACLCPGDPVLDPLSQKLALVGVAQEGVAQAALEGVALKGLVDRVLGGLVGVLVA